MNNLNIFERRALERSSNKFSNLIPNNENPEMLDQDVEEVSGNIFERHAAKNRQKEQQKFGFLETMQDVGEQTISKGVSGVGGAYGNILDAFGMQAKETLPGENVARDVEFQAMERMQNPESSPSFSDIYLASGEDDILPRYSRLPNSQQINKGVEAVTGIGEGRTPAGRIAGNTSQFIGEGVATGSGLKGLVGLGMSGAAGQGVREAGGPEGLATGIEIVGPIGTSVVQGKLTPSTLTKSGRETKKLVDAGRQLGLTEKQITPLIQGEAKAATLSKVAHKGTKTKNLFSEIKQKLGDSYSTIKSSKDAKVKIPNSDQIKLRKDFGSIRNELSKTLAESPDKQAAIDYIEKALTKLRNVDVTPEHLVNFWQDINRSVNWNSINGGKKALSSLKSPISKVLEKVSPKLAKDFEMTNQLYSRYAQISKKLKPNIVDAFINKGEIIAAVPSGIALATGNPWPLTSLATESSVRLLGREMLINPYFQNIGTKLVTNLNNGSQKGVTQLVKQAREYMERKHPNENWSFLTEKEENTNP